MGERKEACEVSVGKGGSRLHGMPRKRWEDNIKMNIQEIGGGRWIGLMRVRIWTNGGLF